MLVLFVTPDSELCSLDPGSIPDVANREMRCLINLHSECLENVPASQALLHRLQVLVESFNHP